jgi:LmbE family N-acetylglucosaminyl deacetylase
MARALRSGGEVTILIVTEGSTTQYPGDAEMVKAKQSFALLASERLGGATVNFANLPDMALSTLPPAQVSAPIEEFIRQAEPEWILTHSEADLNQDHRIVHEATRVAARPVSTRATRLLAYEVPSSSEWGYGAFQPDVFVALDQEDLQAKKAALSAYAPEIREWPHPRSLEGVENMARIRGQHVSRELAEAYRTIWERI